MPDSGWAGLHRAMRRTPDQLATELMRNLNHGAIPMVRASGSFQAYDSTNWVMSTHRTEGNLTGEIILLCHDQAALVIFIRLAQNAGHKIRPAGAPRTILITPRL